MSPPIRVRFAPSPTGFLHVGGVRTALFNWLYARRQGGSFFLRIEDTDVARSNEAFVSDILQSLRWLGLEWDGEIMRQSDRLAVYRQKADALVAARKAYCCTCSEEELTRQREAARKESRTAMYDRRCRDRSDGGGQPETPFVIRARLPLDGEVGFDDRVRGRIHVHNRELDDFVIIRSDGTPTYNFACVIDDAEQGITHVIRGEDHLSNTPKQIHLYALLDLPVPQFAHLPMILGTDKKKLSKRHGAVSANQYRADGYLAEALLNFLARIGWSHGNQEVFSTEELVQLFDLDRVQVSSGVFDPEKLLWLNAEHLRRSQPDRLAGIVARDYSDVFLPPSRLDRVTSPSGVAFVREITQKVKTLKDAADQLRPLLVPGVVEVPEISGDVRSPERTAALKEFAESVTHLIREKVEENKAAAESEPTLLELGVSAETVEKVGRTISEKHGIKIGILSTPIRLALSGSKVSVGPWALVVGLPVETATARIRAAVSAFG